MRELIRTFKLRVRALIKRRQLERDLEDELSYHLELRRANAPSRAPFGNVTLIQEACREMWTFNRVEDVWRDVRHGARILWRAPIHTLTIVLLLAIGIGANGAIFSLISALFIRDLPVDRPEELVVISRMGRTGTTEPSLPANPWIFSHPLFEDLRKGLSSVRGLVAIGDLANARFALERNEELSDISGSIVSGNYFELLGIRMAIGRAFNETDDSRQSPNAVMVLSNAFWKTHLGGDVGVIGRRVFLSGQPLTVIGVAAEEHHGLGSAGGDFWVPLNLQPVVRPGGDLRSNSGSAWLRIIGRLKPGVSIQQAQAELTVLSSQLTGESLASALQAESGRKGFGNLRGQYGTSLQVLFGAVGLLLLMACANVASLLLARMGARQREIAVRQALGCSRARLIRRFFIESLILAGCGGLLGLVFAAGARGFILKVAPESFASVDISLDSNVLLFTIVVSFVAAILFGLAPTLRASQIAIEGGLKSASRSTTGAPSRYALNKALVVIQVALSVALAAGAVLFGQSLYRLYSIDPGFDRRHVITATLNTRALGYRNDEQYAGMAKRLLDRVSALPGIRSVSVASSGFLTGTFRTLDVFIEGQETLIDNLRINQVSRDFLATLGVRIVAGRVFSAADSPAAPRAAVINEAFARSYFAGQNAVGKRFWPEDERDRPIEIIGVVKDSKYNDFREASLPLAFLPLEQFPGRFNHVQLRVESDRALAGVMSSVRQTILDVDSRLQPSRVETLDQSLDRIISRDILLARISAVFGALGILISCFGVYGMISYLVASRTAEIGIRLAIGARPGQVHWHVIRNAIEVVAPGVAIGVVLILAGERLIESFLFEARGRDVLTHAAIAGGILFTALLAAYFPARAAARVDPIIALRSE